MRDRSERVYAARNAPSLCEGKVSIETSRLMPRRKSAGQVTPYSGEVRWCASGLIKRAGQVTIELLLVLPVFMILLFFIMEMGNMGFQTILAHHCAYELARIGSLVAGPNGANAGKPADIGKATTAMNSTLHKMFPSSPGVHVEGELVGTLMDQQSHQMGQDLVVTLTYPAKLIFPGSSQVLADEPKAARIKRIIVTVRMPVEMPYEK